MSNYFDKYFQIKMKPVVYATVTNGGNPTTFMAVGTSDLSSEDNFYVGDTIEFTSGAVLGLSGVVTAYDGTSKTFTVKDINSTIPDGVSFNIYDTLLLQDDLHSNPFTNLAIMIQPTSVTSYAYRILYGEDSQQTGSVSNLREMVTYTDRTQTFPANQRNSNWAKQQYSTPIIGYPIYVNIVHKSNTHTLFKISIVSTVYSNSQ